MAEGQGVRSLNRGLQVLELVGELQPAGVSAIARELDEPKSSVQRVLRTLESAGWVTRAGGTGSGWILTQRVARLGGQVGGDLGLRSAALPTMESLRSEANETVHLAVAEPPSMVLIERLVSNHPVRYVEPLGGLAPMALTATGRASLSTMPSAEVERILAQETRIDSDEQREHILELIAEAGRQGYATTSDWRDGVRATAAPIVYQDGAMPPPALSISAPMSRVDEGMQARHAELITAAVAEIQRRL